MIANVKNLNGFHKGEIAGKQMTSNDALFRFWDELIVDKRAIYVERVNLIGKTFYVDYCHEWLLNGATPDWSELQIAKEDLVNFFIRTGIHKWERPFPGQGEASSYLTYLEAEASLLSSDQDYLYDLVRNYIESLNIKS